MAPPQIRPSDLPTRTTPIAAVTLPADPKPQEGSAGDSTGGLELVPWVDIEVSALGYCDHGQDGLRNDHKVASWDYFGAKAVTPTWSRSAGSTVSRTRDG